MVWVRFIFEYIYKRLEQNGVTKTNTVKWIACIIRCALKMLQKFVQYTNRNAQVVAAISGDNYCKSVVTAMKLMMSNIKAVAMVNTLGDMFIFMTKVAVTTLSGFFCYFFCRYTGHPN